MEKNDQVEAPKMRLSDYAKPVPNRTITRVNAPIGQKSNLKMDSHTISLLPSFHGLPSEDPYKHTEEFTRMTEFLHFGTASLEVVRMPLSLHPKR